jgi:hypothetical protein
VLGDVFGDYHDTSAEATHSAVWCGPPGGVEFLWGNAICPTVSVGRASVPRMDEGQTQGSRSGAETSTLAAFAAGPTSAVAAFSRRV